MFKKNISKKEHIAYIGVGSNMGNRFENIKTAEKELNNSSFCKVIEISKIYETEPVGYLDQAFFLNCVFKITTFLAPDKLLTLLLDTEKRLKRKRIIHWGPRTIDLDILFYDNLVISSKDLIIPHPRLHERMFVLKPLCDLAPDYVHPVIKEQCSQIAGKIEGTQTSPEEWFPS